MGQLLLCLTILIALLCILASLLDATRAVRWKLIRECCYWLAVIGILGLLTWLAVETFWWPPGPFRGKWGSIAVSLAFAWLLGTLAVRWAPCRPRGSEPDAASPPTWPPIQPIAILVASLCVGSGIGGFLAYQADLELDAASIELKSRLTRATDADGTLLDAEPRYLELLDALEGDQEQEEIAEAIREHGIQRVHDRPNDAEVESIVDGTTGAVSAAELKRFLARHRAHLERVVETALDPALGLRPSILQPGDAIAGSLTARRAAVYLLRSAQVLALHERDAAAALRYARASCGIARQQLLPGPRSLLDYMIGIAFYIDSSTHTLEPALALDGWTEADLIGLTLEGEEPFRKLVGATLEWEELRFVTILLGHDPVAQTDGLKSVVTRGMGSTLYKMLFASQELEGFHSALAIFRSAIETSYEAAREVPADPLDGLRIHGFISGFVLPTLFRAGREAARADAQHHLTRTALATVRYRLRNGSYPSTLAALVPGFLAEVPNDPFGSGPLKLRAERTGIVIYSVGNNGVDDGGTRGPEDRQALDFCFSLLQPPAAE